MFRRSLLAFFAAAAVALVGSVSSAQNFQNSSTSALLLTLSDEFSKVGIQAATKLPAQRSGAFVELAPLEAFPASLEVAAKSAAFGDLFTSGVTTEARLLAVKTSKPPERNLTEEEFKARWDRAPSSNRIFVSFAGKDIGAARQVQLALERQGYTVFMYRDPSTAAIKTNSVEVGRYFREAGHHLVLDSVHARASPAVHYEATQLRGKVGELPLWKDPLWKKPNQISDAECCQLCTFLNGVMTHCGPVQCGPQCIGAR